MDPDEPEELTDADASKLDDGQPAAPQNTSEWGHMVRVIRERITRPISRPIAVLYFGFWIVLLGGAGLWVSLGFLCFSTEADSSLLLTVLLSTVTYGAALLGTALLDTFLEVDLDRPTRLSLLTCCVLAGVATAVLVAIWRLCVSEGNFVSWFSFVLALLFIWFSWWVVSASDRRFMLDPMAPAGGDPNRELRNS